MNGLFLRLAEHALGQRRALLRGPASLPFGEVFETPFEQPAPMAAPPSSRVSAEELKPVEPVLSINEATTRPSPAEISPLKPENILPPVAPWVAAPPPPPPVQAPASPPSPLTRQSPMASKATDRPSAAAQVSPPPPLLPLAAPAHLPAPARQHPAVADPAPPPLCEGNDIHIHIGRVEVTAVQEHGPAHRPSPRVQARPALSLEDYLARRNGGRP